MMWLESSVTGLLVDRTYPAVAESLMTYICRLHPSHGLSVAVTSGDKEALEIGRTCHLHWQQTHRMNALLLLHDCVCVHADIRYKQ